MVAGGHVLVVAGNIATGKTHLAEKIGDALALPCFLERWQENPWFGGHPNNAFAAQMWFLLAAGADHARMADGGGVQERSIHEHAHVFAHEQLAGGEARLLDEVYSRLDATLPDPDLLIYLRASAPDLYERVRQRGRPQERYLTVEQLQRLESSYEQLVAGWARSPVVEIDTESVDLRSADGARHVLELLSERLS